MIGQENAIRDIYTSDVILVDKEIEMCYGIDDSYFDVIESLYARMNDDKITIEKKELDLLEKKFNEFYFEYAYVQFKRGLILGLAFKDIH